MKYRPNTETTKRFDILSEGSECITTTVATFYTDNEEIPQMVVAFLQGFHKGQGDDRQFWLYERTDEK